MTIEKKDVEATKEIGYNRAANLLEDMQFYNWRYKNG